MNVDSHTIDQIVQSVLKQLQQSPHTGTSVAVESAKSTPSIEESPGVHSLVLADRVITGELLEASLKDTTKAIQLATNAILTPTARDVVRKRGLQLSRNSGASHDKPMNAAPWRILLSATPPAVQKAAADLQEQGLAAVTLVGTSDEATKLAVSSLCRSEVAGIVAIVSEPQRAACLANRSPKVRAAVIQQAREIDALKKQLGPNLLCLEPGQRSYFELRNVMRSCVASGVPQLPCDWA